jgi:hypothetical protein
MSKYKVIHAGENSQFGGVKAGLASEAYQVGIAGVVNNEPMKPANWQATTHAASFKIRTIRLRRSVLPFAIMNTPGASGPRPGRQSYSLFRIIPLSGVFRNP